MNICFVTLRMSVGGAERVIAGLSRGLHARGHRVSVISEGGVFADGLVADGAAEHFTVAGLTTRTPASLARSAFRLRGILRELRPDVINVHAYSALPSVVAACRMAGIRPRLCYTLHLPMKESYYHVMGPTLAHMVDEVSTVCVDLLHRLCQRGMPQTLGRVIYNGIDATWLRHPDEIDARPLPGTRQPIRLGILARVQPHKGHGTVIEALARLRSAGNTALRLEIAGDGPHRPVLEARVRELGLSDQVVFHGNRSDAHAFLDEVDLFVLPSFLEGFPMSILEAMARGTPVLSSAVNGVPEVIHEGTTGFLFPAGNVPALTRALERILADPGAVGRVRREARAVVAQKFLTGHMVEQYERWFQGAL